MRYVGEGAFADYFEKTYLTPPWDRWYIGASPAGVGSAGQQLIENSHCTDKTILGKNALRVTPEIFFRDSLTVIMKLAGEKLLKHPPDTVSSFCLSLEEEQQMMMMMSH